jgi:hypothetical protein
MPTYSFHHEESGETIDLYLDLKQPAAAYRQQVRDGKVYRRVYTTPQMRVSVAINDGTLADYKRVTEGKGRLTVNEMAAVSKEMAEKRATKEGTENVKGEFYRHYEKKIGAKHKDEVRQTKLKKAHKSLKRFGVNVDMSKS